jgi:pimeloyl-ACP methyl ester carboxylesterase
MEAFIPFETQSCQGKVVEAMMGGSPAQFPERYAQASAIKMLPLGIPQVLIWGDRDNILPLSVGEAYEKAAKAAGDNVVLQVFPGVGHYEIVSPLTASWPVVRCAIESLLQRQTMNNCKQISC